MWIILRGGKASPPPPLRMERGVKSTLDQWLGKKPPQSSRGCGYFDTPSFSLMNLYVQSNLGKTPKLFDKY